MPLMKCSLQYSMFKTVQCACEITFSNGFAFLKHPWIALSYSEFNWFMILRICCTATKTTNVPRQGWLREFAHANQHPAWVAVICTTCMLICTAVLWYVWGVRSKETFTEVQMLIFLLLVLFWEYANNSWNDWHQRSLISISQFHCASFGNEMRQHSTFSLSTRTMQIKGSRLPCKVSSSCNLQKCELRGIWMECLTFNYRSQCICYLSLLC